jgi:HPr kinase/phosphorylase
MAEPIRPRPSEVPPAPSRTSEEPSVTVSLLLADPNLAPELRVIAGVRGLERTVRNARVQKSGLALAGHFHGVESWRVQILGATEISYLETLDQAWRAKACREFAELRPCVIFVTRGVVPPKELLAACEATDTPLVIARPKSSTTINMLHAFLDVQLAPRARVHGVMITIFGVGVLLLGRSGIGKSECALDLVMRGHRLVADDAVECVYQPPGVIIGSAAALLEHHIEIRGLGILNVKDLFGVTSVAEHIAIDLVVQLSDEKETSGGIDYDRLGLDERHHRILGVDIPEVTVPVRPGRDIATILEIAARNELLKRAGHHGAKNFRDRLEKALLGGVADARGLSEEAPRGTLEHTGSLSVRPPGETGRGGGGGEQ